MQSAETGLCRAKQCSFAGHRPVHLLQVSANGPGSEASRGPDCEAVRPARFHAGRLMRTSGIDLGWLHSRLRSNNKGVGPPQSRGVVHFRDRTLFDVRLRGDRRSWSRPWRTWWRLGRVLVASLALTVFSNILNKFTLSLYINLRYRYSYKHRYKHRYRYIYRCIDIGIG